MSIKYDAYLQEHRKCVLTAYRWIVNNIEDDIIQEILPDLSSFKMYDQLSKHDASKNSNDEYWAYDSYFYKNGDKTEDGIKEFNKAWLHHIHHNPHHWQHWVLIEDDENSTIAIDMPDNYILEMICDWWSFSWKKYFETRDKSIEYSEPAKQFLYEIYDWYNNHINTMVLSDITKSKVESLLYIIRQRLDSSDYIVYNI